MPLSREQERQLVKDLSNVIDGLDQLREGLDRIQEILIDIKLTIEDSLDDPHDPDNSNDPKLFN